MYTACVTSSWIAACKGIGIEEAEWLDFYRRLDIGAAVWYVSVITI